MDGEIGIGRLAKYMQELQQDNADLRRQLAKTKKEVGMLDAAIRTARTEIATLQAENERLRKAHNGEVCVDVQEYCDKLKDENERLKGINVRFRERLAQDPWWYAYTEYIDEGWCGPFDTIEAAETHAQEGIDGGDHEPDDIPAITYQQHHNPEGAAALDDLQRRHDALREAADEAERLMRLT